MKIAQVINSLDTGGAEKLTIELSKELKYNEIDSDIIVLRKTESIFDLKDLNIAFLGCKSVYNPVYLFKIRRYLKSYDVIHCHLFPTLYWVVFAKIISFSKVKLVFTEHSTDNRRRSKFILKLVDRFVYSFINQIVCITNATKDNLFKHISVDKNISVINNAVDLKLFEKTYVQKTFFGKSDFIIIQVSSFREQKDQKTLIKALEILPVKFKLILVGDGSLIEDHKEYTNNNHLSQRVAFLGNRSDIPEILQSSDVVVQSSHYEGFGIAALEGMAANKPVIASDVEGLREVVSGYGLLFKKGDHKQLAELILKLNNDSGFYSLIQEKCFGRSKDFSIQKMTKDYIKIYKRLLN
jgi:glycosyltransferase involved in cell wall biosynthesis